MRTAYLGTSEFAATVLRRLVASPHKPALVVAPPDRPRGRGQRLTPPPAAVAARELGLKLHQTADVNDPEALRAIGEAAPDAVAVCAFGQLIKEPLLSERVLLNVHPSLIPRWRGAAPIERAIIAGDRSTGITIMRVTAGLDAGPVALQEEVPIGAEDGFESTSARLAERGGELLVRAFDVLERGELDFTDQDEERATYAEKISPEERRLDPAQPAEQLAWVVRALNPHVGTHLELEGGERLGVREARAVASGPPLGEIEAGGGAPVLGTAEGGLRLDVLQAPGGRPMAAADFLRGHEIPSAAI